MCSGREHGIASQEGDSQCEHSIFIGFISQRFSISMDSAFLNLWLPSIVPYASIDIYAHFRGQDFCRRLLIHETMNSDPLKHLKCIKCIP